MMNWKEIWVSLFGGCEWLGLNIGFWVSMAVVIGIVILMNVVFWGMKPQTQKKKNKSRRSFSLLEKAFCFFDIAVSIPFAGCFCVGFTNI